MEIGRSKTGILQEAAPEYASNAVPALSDTLLYKKHTFSSNFIRFYEQNSLKTYINIKNKDKFCILNK
jgi:hypothetical protein